MKKIVNLLISLVVFLIAISIANATGNSLVVEAVLIAFIIQWIAFIPAYVFQTEKFYDLTGTLTYLSVTWYALYMSSDKFTNLNGASIAIVLLISIWAIRLGSFLFSRIHKDGEDKRFRTIKPSATQFFMTWTLQGLWVSLCSMCALTAISSESGVVVNAFYYLGIGLFIYGFYTEVKADNEKSKFRSVPENREKFITTGLWAKSRHPNYFGEIVLWTAIAVISLPSLSGLQYITLISPIFTYVLLVHVSGVRMLEARGQKQWGHLEEYKAYHKSTTMLFPKL